MSLKTVVSVVAAAGLAAAQSAGCGGTSPPASGTKTVTINGQNREYILSVPEGYDASTPHRLVVGYHWLGGSMQNVAESFYGLQPLSEGTTVFIAPNGLDAGWANTNGDDIAFTDAFIEAALTELCIDETQIFATGFSYGGAMSFAAACARPDVFRAVAPIAGAQLSGCDGGTTPVAYFGTHGVVDSVLNISLGRELRDKFLGLNGCASQEAPEPAAGSSQHILTEYTCTGPPVWWAAHSGDHVGDPTDAGTVWLPEATWRFFTEVA
jgi:poly(3-hydroxybutyrate) depolymerase